MNKESQICQNCRNNFTIEPEDFEFYKKIGVPAPTFCRDCRARRRMVFWNQHNLFRKNDALTGKEIFSTYPESAPLKIYDHDYWWSDAWDPMHYGKEYDFSKSFFEQFRDLAEAVPWPSRAVKNMINSDYCNQASRDKNCYLCFDGADSEDCMYGVAFNNCRNSLDFYRCGRCELCYEIFGSGGNYKTFFSVEVGNCRDSWFLFKCTDCSNCFGCVNLSHKQYYIFNQPYTKEDYFKKLEELNLGSFESLQKIKRQAYAFWLTYPRRYAFGFSNKNVIGENIYTSKNVFYSYHGNQLENVRYSQSIVHGVKDSMDYTNWGQESELVYEAISCGENCYNLKFCFDCWPNCRDLEYCMNCHSSADLFGCVGLTKKQYCIFNRQYTKDEYARLKEKIIGQMKEIPYQDARSNSYHYGEFFPMELSPLAYNESSAQDYYPRIKEQAIAEGFVWNDPSPREYEITILASELPDRIQDVSESVTNEIIGCMNCKRGYRIVPPELQFYKQLGLPVPRLCHNCRYTERMKFKNPLAWQERQCMCQGSAPVRDYQNVGLPHTLHSSDQSCPVTFQTTYAPDRPEIVYCEQCYNNEVS